MPARSVAEACAFALPNFFGKTRSSDANLNPLGFDQRVSLAGKTGIQLSRQLCTAQKRKPDKTFAPS
jgi:hypothetical protein